jgi:electron transport complex protein RnfE
MVKKIIKDGLFTKNPTFVQLIGLCPTLAVTTSVNNAIGMGLAATFVLIMSNIFVSSIRKVTPDKIRIPAFITIIATFVTIVSLFMHAYIPSLYESLGIFLPLIVVNCIIFARAESFASKNNVFYSALDGLFMGLGFTGALIIMGSVREIAGSGTFFGYPLWDSRNFSLLIEILPPGGFLTLGLLIALFNSLKKKPKKA